MSGIRGRDTKPELSVRSYLHRAGFCFTLDNRRLPGRPDIVLPKWSVAVLIHGCFWHGHQDCRYFRLPGTRREFWAEKIRGNVIRDQRVIAQLTEGGWRVAVVWECALRERRDATLESLSAFIRSDECFCEFRANTAPGATRRKV